MMTGTITALDRETLRTIRAKVFRRRESTMIQQAAEYSMADYEATLTVIRTRLLTLLQALPDSAFRVAPTTEASNAWTAGQVVAHIYDAQENIFLKVARRAAGLPPGSSLAIRSAAGSYPTLTREESQAMLDAADRDLWDVFEAIPADIDLSRNVHDERIGTSGVRDSLLYLAIHDDDHFGQLQHRLAG